MEKQRKVFVAGHQGMVGSAVSRALSTRPGVRVITRSRSQLDLTDQRAVHEFLLEERPDEVYLAAAKVGGIYANNTFPAEFIYVNMMIELNVVHGAYKAEVERLLFLGSSCIYPRLASQPMREDCLLTGRLEPTNEPYAVAKIAGIKLCESYNRQYGVDYRSLMPTNLYGPGDSYHPENSHVIPALIRRFHEAKLAGAESVTVWGSGTPRREFLFVSDLADACLHVMGLDKATYDRHTSAMLSHINVGTGSDVTIRELAELISRVVGFDGVIEFDPEKPDGAPRKLLDCSRIWSLGWRAKTGLEEGLASAYADFLGTHVGREYCP